MLLGFWCVSGFGCCFIVVITSITEDKKDLDVKYFKVFEVLTWMLNASAQFRVS